MWFSVVEELVNSTAIIAHSNMLKPYMEVLILLVLHVPPEKHPTENGVTACRKIVVALNDSQNKTSIFSCTRVFTRP